MNTSIIAPLPEDMVRAINDAPRSKRYYNNLDLHPSSDLHRSLLRLWNSCAAQGKAVVDPYVPRWDLLDWARDGYMPADAVDRRIKGKDLRKPVVSQVPLLHSDIELFTSQFHHTFVRADGIHRYKGNNGPESMAAAAKMEKVVARQSHWFRQGRVFDLVIGDAFTYGIGCAYLKWSKVLRPEIDREVVDKTLHDMLKGTPGVEVGKAVRWISDKMTTLREGTEWVHITPYQLMLDPNVTIDNIYESEFLGFMRRTRGNSAAALEQDPEEMRINSEALRILSSGGLGTSIYYRDQSRRREGTDGRNSRDVVGKLTSWVDEGTMFVRIRPSDWKVGDSSTPSWFLLTVAGDRIITQFEKVPNRHGMPPFVLTGPNARGSQIIPCSHAMTVYPLQEAASWTLKSHIDNRRMMNNRFIMHPKYLQYQDFKRSEDGPMVVRVREDAMTTDMPLEKMYHQIQSTDLTRDAYNEIRELVQMSRENLGTQELLQGIAGNLPERPTATGMNNLQQGAQSRIYWLMQVVDIQMMQPGGYQMAWNSIQWMENKVSAEILGRWKDTLEAEAGVSSGMIDIFPHDLTPDFDVQPFTDAFQPQDDMSSMTEIAKTLMAAPGVVEMVIGDENIRRFLTHVWRKAGVDMPTFVPPPPGGNIPIGPQQLITAQQAQLQSQAGNLVPFSQAPKEAFS